MDLNAFFSENPRVAVAFSGGVDSAYLLYAAVKNGADATAYYVKSAFQPAFELEDAKRAADYAGAKMKILEADVLSEEEITANPPNRCYYCKRKIFGMILAAAKADGYMLVLDGTNASDDSADRPGMRALTELSVRSPLRECGLTKEMIRKLSKEAGLFTWNKPSYACLATRIPAGEQITQEKLEKTERAEAFLQAAGFRNFRIRLLGGAARLQIEEAQWPLLLQMRPRILGELKKEYTDVLLDLAVRQPENGV